MTRALLLLALAGAATTVACADQHDPVAPAVARTAAPAATRTTPAGDAVDGPLGDALERVGPALGESAEADDVRALLRSITLQRGDAAPDAPGRIRALEAALDRLERKHPALAAETDAVRLALGASDAGRMHKP